MDYPTIPLAARWYTEDDSQLTAELALWACDIAIWQGCVVDAQATCMMQLWRARKILAGQEGPTKGWGDPRDSWSQHLTGPDDAVTIHAHLAAAAIGTAFDWWVLGRQLRAAEAGVPVHGWDSKSQMHIPEAGTKPWAIEQFAGILVTYFGHTPADIDDTLNEVLWGTTDPDTIAVAQAMWPTLDCTPAQMRETVRQSLV